MASRAGSRITDSPEFDRVYRQGAAYRGKLFSVHAFAKEHGSPRLGLSVSKKVGKAVVRNKVRRRMKEIFHARTGELEGMGSGLDFVVSARPASSDASFRDLEREFSVALKKLEGRV
ncbi:MAG: ribonuclease P protein component [Actinomycetota bacterium]|nr:ribonuclease P protein component [Rubrobacter sp.]MDQ3509824.1 ribonuclease P protein component [Actinomycetota bacterium]